MKIAYYLPKDWEINFAPGLIISDSSFPDGFAGYSVETNLSWNDHFGLTTRLDIVDNKLNPTEVFLNLGIQTDGQKGLWIAGIGALVGIIQNIRRKN